MNQRTAHSPLHLICEEEPLTKTETGFASSAQTASENHKISSNVESFYHLSGCALDGKACSGTACFVARHLNPHRWAEAEKQHPQVYCLGQCFAAPAIAVGRARPRVEVRSREGIVLSRLVSGNVRVEKATDH